MRICIIGAGAIGGLLGSGLARTNNEINLIARGDHYRAIKKNGLRVLFNNGKEIYSRPNVFDQFEMLGKQDLIILALKAHQIKSVAANIANLFHKDTIIVTLQNGIPFWYFHGIKGALAGLALETVDPGGIIISHIESHRILHSVVYPAAQIISPGIIHHHGGDRFPVGELDNSQTERVRKISLLFNEAGFRAPILQDTRGEVWLKLLGNVTFNPISALSHATVIDLLTYPLTRSLVENMMIEAQTVATSLGVRIRLPIERRISGAEKLGSHKMSMLQDIEAGRALEIDALVGAVAEIGHHIDVPTPCIDTLYAITKLLEKKMNENHACIQLTPLP
ncbi:MAG TPA: 2-dehydropantoate 2-reductase [Burkholderiales bacterium]|nr:2-dehydropantoate 2-reductase [Burkholderiales bacterium]